MNGVLHGSLQRIAIMLPIPGNSRPALLESVGKDFVIHVR